MAGKTHKKNTMQSSKADSDLISSGQPIARGPKSWSEDIWALLISGTLLLGVMVQASVAPDFKFESAVYKWEDASGLLSGVLGSANLLHIGLVGVLFAVLSAVATGLSGGNVRRYLLQFFVVFLAATASLILAGNKSVNGYGIEYVVFALIIGLVLSNGFGVTLSEAARSEFFIKTGLVLLGAGVLFRDIVQAGLPGILQAIAVVSVVWVFSLWLSRRLRVDDEFGVIIASAVSICGVSAAIVAAGAMQGDKRKLSYVTTLVLLVALPMLVLQPWAIRALGIPELVGGAWLGGTLDTTASVTAAAQLVGGAATKAGVIVKFSQNVLIGIAAFFIATWWALRKNGENRAAGEKPGMKLVWERFPKFVLGFIAASLVFSFLIPAETVAQAGGFLKSLQTMWFALAFVAIGLEARFSDLLKMQGGRPALAFVGAQVFNIAWTLLWAFLLFGGVLMAVPEIQ